MSWHRPSTWHSAMERANQLARDYQLRFRVYSIRYPEGMWRYDVCAIPIEPANPWIRVRHHGADR